MILSTFVKIKTEPQEVFFTFSLNFYVCFYFIFLPLKTTRKALKQNLSFFMKGKMTN
jgi:hypothetical protein